VCWCAAAHKTGMNCRESALPERFESPVCEALRRAVAFRSPWQRAGAIKRRCDKVARVGRRDRYRGSGSATGLVGIGTGPIGPIAPAAVVGTNVPISLRGRSLSAPFCVPAHNARGLEGHAGAPCGTHMACYPVPASFPFPHLLPSAGTGILSFPDGGVDKPVGEINGSRWAPSSLEPEPPSPPASLGGRLCALLRAFGGRAGDGRAQDRRRGLREPRGLLRVRQQDRYPGVGPLEGQRVHRDGGHQDTQADR
jgi:hypothetical protein